MATISKKGVQNGVKSMAKKAASWSQVCKQLSGMGGYVDLGEEGKVRPIEFMHMVGVNVEKNSYKPKDIFAAWSEQMKDGEQVLMSKAVPYLVNFLGYDYQLYRSTKDKNEYTGVTKKHLCPLVSAKGDNTVTVNATNVLRGLQQSLYVEDTLEAIKKSELKCEAMKNGYVNLSSDKKCPNWVRIEKCNGEWQPYVSQEEKELAAKEAAKEAINSAKGKDAHRDAIKAMKDALVAHDMGYITEEEYRSRILEIASKVA
jgi:hypothetical protein